MKFFKHFTDAHRGSSLKAIKRELGMAGIGMYWCLVEACAEKLEKDHCEFEFDVEMLAGVMGTKQKCVGNILGSFQEQNLISFVSEGFIIRIKMSNLLEYMDRDSRRARPVRGQSAPKNKKEEEEKDITENNFSNVENTKPKPVDWIFEAELFFQARRIHSRDPDQFNKFLGDDRIRVLKALGGKQFLMGLNDNTFDVKRLATLIEMNSHILNQTQESA